MRSLIVGLLAVSLVGCTPTGGSVPPSSPASSGGSPSSVSAVPSPSPTPSESWDADQAAAVAAVQGYYQVSDELGSNPAKFSKAKVEEKLGAYIGGDLLPPNVKYFVSLAQNGHHEQGGAKVLWIKPSKAIDNHNSRGKQVAVTVCQDLRELVVVDGAGKPVGEPGGDDFVLQQYSVRIPPKASKWRAYGVQIITGKCGQ